MLVAIVPREADGILADRLNLGGPCRRLEHGQRSRDRLDGIARVTAVLLALFVTQGARAGITQKRKAVNGAMAVLPLDLYARTGGDVNFDGFWIGNWVHAMLRPPTGGPISSIACKKARSCFRAFHATKQLLSGESTISIRPSCLYACWTERVAFCHRSRWKNAAGTGCSAHPFARPRQLHDDLFRSPRNGMLHLVQIAFHQVQGIHA
jgi:hypothetical protein